MSATFHRASVKAANPPPLFFLLFLSGLVIEDAPSGLAAGKRAGARTLAVCTNHTREFLQRRTGNEKPDFIIDNLEQ